MSELEAISISSVIDVVCHGWPEDKIKKINEECRQNYIISMGEWGQCKKIFPEKGEGLGGTLFWEFGSVIAELAGHEKDPAYMFLPTELSTAVLIDLNPDSFIATMNNRL